jgi:Family of unknown function (DUF5995)
MSAPPVTSIAEVISRMQAIDATLPVTDGVACFNRMYLEVTEKVDTQVKAGFFADPAFVTQLDVTFASLYFAAVDAAGQPESVQAAWRPLFEQRANDKIESIQFALAGMNAHINHDLPIAVVQTCLALGTSPAAGDHHDDYQKVDELLDSIEQSVRRSFESKLELLVDRHLRAVCNLVGSWSIRAARDLAWGNSLLLWQVRDDVLAYQLACDGLAANTDLASHLLLVEV